jgi:ABC-type lipoprotein release transport system permease subunit
MRAEDRHGERPFLPDEELRRTFFMRSAVIGAAGVMTGCTMSLAVSVVLC